MEEHRREAKAGSAAGSRILPGDTAGPPSKSHLSAFIAEFLAYAEVNYSPKSLSLYKAISNRFLATVGERLLHSVTPKDVDDCRSRRIGEVSPASVNLDLRMLRAAFYTALRWKLLAENPFTRVSLVRIPDQQPVYLSKEELPWLLSFVYVRMAERVGPCRRLDRSETR